MVKNKTEFDEVLEQLTPRQQKLLRILQESGELDNLLDDMAKNLESNNVEETEEDKENEESSESHEIESNGELSPIDMELAESSGLSPEKVKEILAEA